MNDSAWSVKKPGKRVNWSSLSGHLNHSVIIGASMRFKTIKDLFKGGNLSKSEKQALLNELKDLCDMFRIDHPPAYNSEKFSEWLNEIQ